VKVLCPNCREHVKTSAARRGSTFCPRCGEAFEPRHAGDPETAERETPGRRKGGREGRVRRAIEGGRRSRRKGKIFGIALFVVVISISLYFRVIGPLTSDLVMDTEIEGPASIEVSVKHESRRARLSRGRQKGWNVDLEIKLTNVSKKHVHVGDVQVRFYDEAGTRLKTSRSTSLFSGNLMGGDFTLYLSPGESDSYSSMIPYELRTGMGKKRVKCKITLSGVDERDTPLDLPKKLGGGR
jgi:hypothetical protein